MKYSILLIFTTLLIAACTPQPAGQVAETDNKSEEVVQEASRTASATPTAQGAPINAAQEFSTDFSISSIDFGEILSGGPPKDGIPSIDNPEFISVREVDGWINPNEPVILVDLNNEAKAYPLQILVWHEIVNDNVGGIPVIMTFCPLCNTAIAFSRTVEGEIYDFGTTGRLRFSNLIMYDRQTETWWQQAEGKAIIGTLTGTQLEFLPSAIISWDDFKKKYPDGLVLSKQTGFIRSYGRNPYVGYDDVNNPPFLYQGPETPGRLPPVARVLAIEIGTESVAYPYELLSQEFAVNDIVAGEEIAVFWSPGTASALDAALIADGNDVGTAVSYRRRLNDSVLTFFYDGKNIVDNETGSTWDILGNAISGELTGNHLEPVISVNHFWFSWVAFRPETRVYQP
ncbi:MAG: DUF3179 domain-containing protein [Anaerolineaceae bacterium]